MDHASTAISLMPTAQVLSNVQVALKEALGHTETVAEALTTGSGEDAKTSQTELVDHLKTAVEQA